MEKIKVAICYDFDKTLSSKNMQEFGFMKSIGVKEDKFWKMCNDFTKNNACDDILTMMKLMVSSSSDVGIIDHKTYFKDLGKTVKLFPGVKNWFERINKYADEMGVEVKHYIVSSGIKEIIEGTSISKYFDRIYASSFVYDEKGTAVWPAFAINYTNKTQYLYRINKGVLEVNDSSINDYMDADARPVPFSNMIYIGDSSTDVPSMRTVMLKGGYAICVYDDKKPLSSMVKNLVKNDKVSFVLPSNYQQGRMLDKVVKDIIKTIKYNSNLKNYTKHQKSKIDKH